MQDRYAGDVGDFMKLGLLRHLAASPADGGAGLTVGLNWYLAPDEAHNLDGKHIAYLQSANRQCSSLDACEPDLMRCLTRVVATGRSVQALEMSGALPAESSTHRERLKPKTGSAGRRAWHRRALGALRTADVVCTDPDNGLASSATVPKLHKYSLMAELADYARRGQSLVAYHHADRSASTEIQARRRLEGLAMGVDQVPLGAVIARRGSCRFFLVTAADPHQEALSSALISFATRWASHAELISAAGL